MAYTEIYVHQVVGLPNSDVGHLAHHGSDRRWTLCGRTQIEQALVRLRERNQELHRQGRHDETSPIFVDPEGRRPCAWCVHDFDQDVLHRLQQIEAMGGRP